MVRTARLMFAVTLLTVVLPSAPARATQSPATIVISASQALYAYVGPDENLDVTFRKYGDGGAAATITVEGPGGVTRSCTNPAAAPGNTDCTLADLTSTQAGIWKIGFGGGQNHSWTINVQNGTTAIPGRVWSEMLVINQTTTNPNLRLWYRSQEGYLYGATYKNYNGISSDISADATGVAFKDTCVSAYESMDVLGPYDDRNRLWRPPLGRCGDPFKIFFEEPAADLPGDALRWDGTTGWVAPPPAVPDITNLAFSPDSDSIHRGTFTFDVTNFTGQMKLTVDANGDGDYTDPEDVAIPVAAKPGPASAVFDGKDAAGAAIPIGRSINARAAILQTGEIHFAQTDVEARQAMTVIALNGPNQGSGTLYWNDTTLLDATPQQPNGQTYKRHCLTPTLDGRAGVDSTNGVHGWPCGNNSNNGLNGSWGDVRVIDDWAYGSANEAEELLIPGKSAALRLGKAVTTPPTPLGGGRYRLAYQVTATNTAPAAGTYSLSDALSFGPGVEIEAATVATVPGGIAVNGQWNGIDNIGLVSAQPISGAPAGGATVHTYTVTATVTVPPDLTTQAADCTAGAGEAGTGLLNRATLVSSAGVQESEACAPVPTTTIDKQFVDVRRLGANQFELVYSLSVSQTGGNGVYDLTDRLRLGTPVGVTAATVTNTAPGTVPVDPGWNGAASPRIASNVPIAPGDPHVYEVKVTVTLDTGAVTPANSDCALGSGEPGTGAMNTASVTVNGITGDDSDCVPFPATSVAKTVSTPPAPAGDGTFRVGYTLKVRNTGPAPDTYDLEDRLAFTDGATVVAATVSNAAPGGPVPNPGWGKGTPADPTVVRGVPIGPAGPGGATTHEYTVTVVFKPAANLTAGQADCEAGAGETGTGLKNVAIAVVGGDRQAPQEVCAEVPRTVFDKELRSIDPNGDGTFALRYELTVDRFGAGAPYTLQDTLHFGPAATVTRAKVVNTAPGTVTVGTGWNGTTDTVIASDVALGDGERHTYTVLVVAAVNQAAATATDRDCLLSGAEQASGFGNTASLTSNGTTTDDSACGEIPAAPPGDPSPVDIDKDIVGPAVPDGATSTVTYRLTVTNPGESKATYDLTDHLRLGGGVTAQSVSATNTTPGDIAVNAGWNGTTNPVLAAGRSIEPGAVHHYTVTLRLATGPTAGAEELDCSLALGQIATGARNAAAVKSGGVEHSAAACTPVEVAAAAVVVQPGSTGGPSVGGLLPPAAAADPPAAVLPVTGTGVVADLLRTVVALILGGAALMAAGRRRPERG